MQWKPLFKTPAYAPESIDAYTKSNSLSQSHLAIILFGWKVVDSHLHSGL